MDDLDKYILKRKELSEDFAKNFDKGYEEFKIGEILKQARKDIGLSQEDVAIKLHTKKSAISKNNALNYKYVADEKLIEDKKSKKKK